MIGFEKDRIKIGIAGQIIIKRNQDRNSRTDNHKTESKKLTEQDEVGQTRIKQVKKQDKSETSKTGL